MASEASSSAARPQLWARWLRWARASRRELVATAIAVASVAALLAARDAVVPGPLEVLRREPIAAGPDGGVRYAYTGSWRFPRGGPYILGFQSPRGPASLAIDGEVIVRARGKKSARVVYPAGVVAVRLEAPPGARLIWHPPGRRGPAEYVPSSSLSPEPPQRARFGAGVGAARADGVFAAAIGAVGLGLLLYWTRRRVRWALGGRGDPAARARRRAALVMGAVFAVALGVRLIDLGGAGQTWDEDVNWSAGRNYVTNWLSLDFAPSSWTWNYEHPPVMKYIAGVGAQFADGYGPARAMSALCVALACTLLVPIGRRLFGSGLFGSTGLWIGAMAGGIAGLSPHLIAHGKVVGHEAPTVLWWTLAVWLCLRAHDSPRSAQESGSRGADSLREADSFEGDRGRLGGSAARAQTSGPKAVGAEGAGYRRGRERSAVGPELRADGAATEPRDSRDEADGERGGVAGDAGQAEGVTAGESEGGEAGEGEDDEDESVGGRGEVEGGEVGTGRLVGRLAVIGVVFGLAVSSRFVNALMAPLIGGLLVLYAPRGQRWRTVWLGLAIIPAVAVALGVAIWPRLWSEPIAHLSEAWDKLKKPHSPEPFLGQITNRPARYYFLAYLVGTAPLGVLIAAGAGLAAAVARIRARWREVAAVALWLATPMGVMLSPVRQDGVRYIMPSLVALAVVAAVGVWAASRAVAGVARRVGAGQRARGRAGERMPAAVAGALAAAMAVYLALVCARVHPYYLDYYGEHVGGPAGVARDKRFEIAWWGEGVADAVAYVNRHAAPRARVYKRCVEPGHLTWLRGDLWQTEARTHNAADWIIAYQPSWRGCPLPPGAKLVHEVSVDGAPLARVYRVTR